jgi:hypothetical protein
LFLLVVYRSNDGGAMLSGLVWFCWADRAFSAALGLVDEAKALMTFEKVIETYLSARRPLRGDAERDWYSLKQLQPYFMGRRIVDLKRSDIRAYMTLRFENGVKVATVQREKTSSLPAV